jgi:S1-C subfamily serine protease
MVQFPSETLAQVLRRWRENPDEEVVIFLRGMEDRCNAHYQLEYSRVLTHFNGKEVKSLKGLLEDVGKAVTSFQSRAKESLSKGVSPEVGTGCEEDSDFLEFTYLPDANKDTGGSPHGDADMVLMTACAQEASLPGMAKWVNQFGALPASPDLLDTWSSSMLGGQSVADLLGGQEKAAAMLPAYFRPSSADGTKKFFQSGSSFLEVKEDIDSRSQGLKALELPVPVSFLETSEEILPASNRLSKAPQLAQSSSLLETLQAMPAPSALEQLRGYAWSPDTKAPAFESKVKLPGLEFADADIHVESAQPEFNLRGGLLETDSQALSKPSPPDAKAVPSKSIEAQIQSHEPEKAKSESSKAPSSSTSGTSGPLRKSSKNRLPMNNVIRIDSINSPSMYIAPWMPSGESGARCSGIVLDAKARFILTCAHCVGDSKMLFVSREDFPEKTVARVVEVAHDQDLAWLTADNTNGFWDNVEHSTYPVEQEMPGYGSEVQVVGYPIGGTAITQTKGVVARVDAMIYPNGMVQGFRNAASNLLVFQVDAAINPGNSGGPAFNNHGELLGLAFAGLDGAQNVGYVIPNTVVQNFIQAVVRGGQQWIAQTDFGVRVKPMQNPSLRRYWGLGEEDHGVQIRTVAPLSGLQKAGLRKTDVLLSIDGKSVTDDGKVSLKGGDDKFLVDLDVLITQKQRVMQGGEIALRDMQAIGQSELVGNRGKQEKNNAGLPMPAPVGGTNQSVAGENGVSGSSGSNTGGPGPLASGKSPAPWNHPDQLKYVPTNLVVLRRECMQWQSKDVKGAYLNESHARASTGSSI